MNRREENKTAFAIGEKIVCVNDNWVINDRVVWNYPRLNAAYTIEFILPDGCLTLNEVNNSHVDKMLHAQGTQTLASFYPWHFSKLKTFQEKESMAFEEQLKEVGV